jgi:hypothetical protein
VQPYPAALVVQVAEAEGDPGGVFDHPVGGFGPGVSDAGATGALLAAWIAKEELRYLLSLARARPLRSEVGNRLFAF